MPPSHDAAGRHPAEIGKTLGIRQQAVSLRWKKMRREWAEANDQLTTEVQMIGMIRREGVMQRFMEERVYESSKLLTPRGVEAIIRMADSMDPEMGLMPKATPRPCGRVSERGLATTSQRR